MDACRTTITGLLAVVFLLAVGGRKASGQCEFEVLPRGEPSASFGGELSIDGDTLIAAPWIDVRLLIVAALVFERDPGGGNAWTQVAQLVADDPFSGFGSAVALSGSTVLVGAMLDDELGQNAGRAFWYERDAGGPEEWGLVANRAGSAVGVNHIFGNSAAIDGDTAIVGTQGDDWAGTQTGAAYVFQRDHGGPDNWGEVKRLTAPDGSAVGRFGNAVAINGDVAIVGARGDADHTGAAYLFGRDVSGPDNWGLIVKIVASDGEPGDHFGWSVAIDGDLVAVSAPTLQFGFGSAYTFSRNVGGPDVWGELARVIPCDGPVQGFGREIDLEGTTILVSSEAGGFGPAYIFERDAATGLWPETYFLFPSNLPQSSSRWGWTASLSGSTALVGGPNFLTFFPGTAHTFDLPACPPTPLPPLEDCNGDMIIDICYVSSDCNGNDIPDECDIADGTSLDCNDNAVPDECEPDCNSNGIADECDITDGTSLDCNRNGLPDECEPVDCNSNGVPDDCDIADGTSRDKNGDGVPDECCNDFDGDGVTGTADLLLLLGAWGDPGGPADINGDGTVGTADLLILLQSWGPCA